jgi:hypothetical protein
MSENLKATYRKLSPELRARYRQRFAAMIAELVVYEELTARRHRVSFKTGPGNYDLLVNGKRVELKACNTDFEWIARSRNPMYPGCAEIMPSQFDILIYVEFSDTMDVIDFFIFTRRETLTLPFTHQERTGYAKRYQLSESPP